VENAEITSPLVDCFASNFTEGTVVRNVTCNAPGWSGFNADPATNLTFDGNKVNGSGTFYRCPDTPWERPGIYARGVLGSTMAIGDSKRFFERRRTLPDRISAAPIASAQRA
jgi:hypothetical protein